MGTKGGNVLYHIEYGGYGTTLGCHVISDVTCCNQPKCWLTSVG
jgi:L,D-peptidoglycan transpeptidase YkuD (ErfK/YbiS/YcfS/YnhG family)